jgi:hypothetical protein
VTAEWTATRAGINANQRGAPKQTIPVEITHIQKAPALLRAALSNSAAVALLLGTKPTAIIISAPINILLNVHVRDFRAAWFRPVDIGRRKGLIDLHGLIVWVRRAWVGIKDFPTSRNPITVTEASVDFNSACPAIQPNHFVSIKTQQIITIRQEKGYRQERRGDDACRKDAGSGSAHRNVCLPDANCWNFL